MNTETGQPAVGAGILTPLRDFFAGMYGLYKFIAQFFKQVFVPPYEWREIINQCYEIGCKTLPLISLTGFITGLVFTKQSRPALSEFGAASWLPSLVTIAIVRALAPLVTSLIFAGKVGSNIGAELGSMRVSEQIDAMEMTAANPFKFLVVTRIMACSLILPLLVIYSGGVSILGAYLNVHSNELTSFRAFVHDGFSNISFLDVFSSLAKSAIYGFTVGTISCFKGYNTANGTVGVGKAANQAVVISMFAIFLEETVIVQFINSFLR
jgi:phospholipid/cholesterol/gamma-HCH transport system permease protein